MISEYYQPKFDALFDALKKFSSKRLGGNNGIVSIKKSIEPGSDAYKDEGIPFIRVRDVSKHEITSPEIYLSHDVVENVKALFPKKIRFSFQRMVVLELHINWSMMKILLHLVHYCI